MKITFWGAARTVTGSMHLLETPDKRILLDCGLFQGHRAESIERNTHFPFRPGSIDLLILSHAHIDHSGNIPNLVGQGFDKDILCTSATADLASAVLRDSGHIQEADAEYVSFRRSKGGLPPVEPLYTAADVERALPLFKGVPYGQWVSLGDAGRVTFLDAGHILGSAIVLLEYAQDRKTVRLAFTGDLGRKNLPIIRDPTLLEDADYLITESTYGDRLHGSIEETADDLKRVVNETFERRGKVLVPAFSVGRTQEIVLTLHSLREAGKMPGLPIYVDSPLALEATEVFRRHPECFDPETSGYIARHEDPFDFKKLHYIRDSQESKSLNSLKEPCIIISGSGMCEAGRIRHHLVHNVGDLRNTVLIVSFQAENTLGRRLVDGEKIVRIFGEEYEVRARVEAINGFSAHADRDDLLGWISRTKDSLKGVYVVHGEEGPARALAQGIQELGVRNVLVPERGETVSL
ncbi:MAG: MBL fold metallo-hydrolase [Chloroflexi bacterium]|nr:MBL fold metallo-hydrolase [Chloroflexota bacterium]